MAMADQVQARKILQELVKREDLQNKICNDCTNPNPQWASLSFAVFICLQCAGQHRGYGVHISFVRSISMDTWQDDQIRRMQLGGNAPFRAFMSSYSPAEQGGYTESMSSYDKYHCWAATQYREKLDAELAGRAWTQSVPPPGTTSPGNGSTNSSRPSSAQGLRKSRASTRTATGSGLRGGSSSPASLSNSPRGTPELPSDQKAANESFFATLGSANASRPTDLPPSQGGRYQGFGSTQAPSSPSQHPSYGLSSAAAPTLNDLQENPIAALSKGWSLFSAAVVGASRVVSENVIQPGMEKVRDPALQASVAGYLTEAQKRAAAVGSSANEWSKNQLGVDVVGTVKDKIGGGPTRSGYGAIGQDHDGESSALYHDDDDLFGEYSHGGETSHHYDSPVTPTHHITATTATASTKKTDWDDDWKDF